MIKLHRKHERGEGHFKGLEARYSFSFARYRNPDRMGFGALRVFNNDVLEAGEGFPTHEHDNFEIITIPLGGAVRHKDSMGNEGVVHAHEVQTMSAGSGIEHSEMNASDSEELELLQIWIETATRDIEPQYDQQSYSDSDLAHQWHVLASNDGGARINQDARVLRTIINKHENINYSVENGRGAFVFVISGGALVNDIELFDRDSLEVTDQDVVISGEEQETDILLIDIPL